MGCLAAKNKVHVTSGTEVESEDVETMIHSLVSPFMGEFMGTMVLVLLGDGVVAGCLLKRSKGEGAGWLTITTAWGIAVFAGVVTATAWGSKDAHLNPAITVAGAIMTGDFHKLAVYIPAQILGAMVGAVLVWVLYLPHWGITEDADAKLGCFCTIPAIRNPLTNVTAELIGTFVLFLVISAIGSRALVGEQGLAVGLSPYLVGFLVWGIGMSLGGPTGYAINPVRDFGPRLVHQLLPIAGKRNSDWGYAWVPIVGPIAGAALAGILIRVFGQ
jgi:glycerol uptake facilitator protein